MQLNLRERTQEVMRAELANAALDMITRDGYDNLTAEDLAKGLGISRASFFRYFGSKDEVVIAAMVGEDNLFADALPPPEPDKSLWQRLRCSVESAALVAEAEPDRLRARVLLIQLQPALGARLRRARFPKVDALAAKLREEGVSEVGAQVLAAATLAALDQCWGLWARRDGASMRTILDEAFVQLETASRL